MTVRYKFTGRAGEYLLGVPAKDLTDDEIESLTPEQRGLLKANLEGPAPAYELQGKGAVKTLSAKMPEGLPMQTRDYVKEGDPNYGPTRVETSNLGARRNRANDPPEPKQPEAKE